MQMHSRPMTGIAGNADLQVGTAALNDFQHFELHGPLS